MEIRSPEELEWFADAQYMITKPLCLRCDSAELLDQALALYQGRALYEGSLSRETLTPLAAKYGLDKPIWQQILIYIGNTYEIILADCITRYKKLCNYDA